MIALKGMSWDHPRGYDPLLAAAAVWRERCGVEIVWDRHSLQHFEAFPIDELARGYDLMVIDHPHIGDAVASGALSPLDAPESAASVGPSLRSYALGGRQWALPIDAAAQVQAYRPDLLQAAPRSWEEALALAREGRVTIPLRAPHSLMSLYTLAANFGRPATVDGPDLFDAEAGRRAVETLAEFAAALDPQAYEQDPIDVLEAIAAPDGRVALSPLIYGYVSYAMGGFRAHALRFADIPGEAGSAIGGAGIAVSAYSAHAREARDFADWIASGAVQRGLYAQAGGQPAHPDAWGDAAVNAASQNFYADTRATLERAFLRPRHAGYLAFQRAASERLNAGLRGREGGATIIAALNALYAANLPRSLK